MLWFTHIRSSPIEPMTSQFIFFLTKTLSPLLLLILISTSCYGEIYKWVDEQGRVHYGDKKRADKKPQEKVEIEAHRSYWQPYNIKITWRDLDLTVDEVRSISDDVNLVYQFYDRVVYFDMHKTVPVNITLLPNQEQYNRHITKVTGKPPVPSWGYYIYKNNEIVVFMQQDRQRTFRTIKHEVSHAIIHTMAPSAPAWLNEGMAELMEYLVLKNDRITILPHKSNQSILKRFSNNRKVDEIDEMLSLPSRQWLNSKNGKDPFLQSMAGEIIFFLFSSNTDRTFVRNLLQDYKRGGRLLSIALVNQYYLGGIGSLNLKWRNWLLQKNKSEIQF